MTNSERMADATEVLDSLIAELSTERLRKVIDEPLERAALAFTARPTGDITQEVFLKTVGAFVEHVYETGLKVPQRLSADQARAEAVCLLESYYQGFHENGYHAALRDTLEPCQNGLDFVLAALKEIVRAKEVKQHIDAAIACAVDPLDWQAQCALTKAVLERFHGSWPAALLQNPASVLAAEWPKLLYTQLDAEAMMRNIIRRPFA